MLFDDEQSAIVARRRHDPHRPRQATRNLLKLYANLAARSRGQGCAKNCAEDD
jgi:hypothetical protein